MTPTEREMLIAASKPNGASLSFYLFSRARERTIDRLRNQGAIEFFDEQLARGGVVQRFRVTDSGKAMLRAKP